ncbi:EFMT3 methyltransferase, partial [Amia calva]|nr:EFMT3 methyltransferase [Amia calva]
FCFGGEELRITQLFSADLGVAAQVWDSALCLCRYLEQQQCVFSGQRVIELGSGTGILGILAARLGAQVTLTDLPHTLPQLRHNVSANRPPQGWPGPPPEVRALCWGKDQGQFGQDWDVVLGADIVYLQDSFPQLLATLAHLCGGGATAYLAARMRAEHGAGQFFGELLPRIFQVELLQSHPESNINMYRA